MDAYLIVVHILVYDLADLERCAEMVRFDCIGLPFVRVQKCNFGCVLLCCILLGGVLCLHIHVHDFVRGLLGFHNFVAQNFVEVACSAYFVVYRIVETVDFDMAVATARMFAVEVGYGVELPPSVGQIVVKVPSVG